MRLRRTIQDPFSVAASAIGAYYVHKCRMHPGIEVKGRLRISGRPMIDIRRGSRLVLGDDVTFNSRNQGYHVNMFGPIKLLADRPGTEIRIGDQTRIHGSCTHAYGSVTIGERCLIAANCQILDGSGNDLSFPRIEEETNTTGTVKPVPIEDRVWLGVNSIVLPGARTGRGAVVTAGSVVGGDIPPLSLVAGNPARVIRESGSER